MSGAIADADVVSEGSPGIGAWGEGLVNRSLASLWYPADWDEASDDELAFLLPALGAWRPGRAATEDHDGPIPYLTRVLKLRALSAAALISAKSRRIPATQPRQALEELLARGILTTISLDDFDPAATDAAGAPSRATDPALRKSRATPDQPGSLPNWLAVEVTALAHLDRLLHDAQGAGHDGTPLVDWPLSLADVIVATVNARLNGAYVHPAYAHAHELLTAAALLGHLVHGRAAYIPPQLAHCLVDLLSRDEKPAAREEDWCAPVLRTYADLAGGCRRTLALAKRAAASGRPYLARPRRPTIPKDIGRTTWNARLFQKITGRWQF
jgi:hypothetical protein